MELSTDNGRSIEGWIARYRKAVICRMTAEGATDTSDAEIERTLSPCVSGEMAIAVAKHMRARGLLVIPTPR